MVTVGLAYARAPTPVNTPSGGGGSARVKV